MSRIRIIEKPGAAAEAEAHRELERQDFLGKRIRFDWSQTRGGTAIFASGRMEGPLFDNDDAARAWLLDDLSIVVNEKGRAVRTFTTQDIEREEAITRHLLARRDGPATS